MTPRFIDPLVKYITVNMGTLPGAKLYFTITGTSTPKTTWADAAMTTPHPYPVVADSNGIFPPIFLDGVYRVELKSSDGITQTGWPIDGVEGLTTTIRNTIDGDLTFSVDNSAIRSNSVDVIEFTSGSGVPKFPIGFKSPNTTISDPLVMDWYEEGLCTPTVYGGASAGTATYSRRIGSFKRDGNRVSGQFDISWSDHTGTGTMFISGLPYTSGKSSSPTIFYTNLLVGAGKQASVNFQSGQTYMVITACDPSGGAYLSLAIDAQAEVIINFDYEV